MSWTIRIWTRHTGESYSGWYTTEAEAHAAAMCENERMRNTGVYHEAVENEWDGKEIVPHSEHRPLRY